MFLLVFWGLETYSHQSQTIPYAYALTPNKIFNIFKLNSLTIVLWSIMRARMGRGCVDEGTRLCYNPLCKKGFTMQLFFPLTITLKFCKTVIMLGISTIVMFVFSVLYVQISMQVSWSLNQRVIIPGDVCTGTLCIHKPGMRSQGGSLCQSVIITRLKYLCPHYSSRRRAVQGHTDLV